MNGETRTINYVRAQTFGGFVRRAFGLYFRNFPVLCGIYLLPMLPVGLWVDSFQPSHGLAFQAATAVATFVEVIVSGAFALAVSEICVGRHPTVMASYRSLAQYAGLVIWTALLVMALITVADVSLSWAEARRDADEPLLVPGLLFVIGLTYLFAAYTYLMFTLSVVVLERVSGMDALKRSIQLVRGFFWRNLGVSFVTIIPMDIAILVIMLSRFALYGQERFDESPSVVDNLIDSLVAGVAVVPGFIVVVLLYYDCRVRKEQFDREQLAQELAQ